MVKNDGTKDTTIARYIARFRSESPCPRSSREKLKQKFWWLQNSQEDKKKDDSEKSGFSSNIQAEETHLTTIEKELDEEKKIEDETVTIPFHPEEMEVSSSIQSLHFENDPLSEDDIAIESMMNSWDFRSQVSIENDEYEDEFEDPELVIQRVRKRLGLSHDDSKFLSGPIPDSPSSSHIPSPQYVKMNLNDLEEINPLQSPVPSHLSEPLSLNTSIHSFSSSSVHSLPAPTPTQRTPPNSVRSDQFHLPLDEKYEISSSSSLQLEEKPTGKSGLTLLAFSPNEPSDSPLILNEQESPSKIQEAEILDEILLPPPLPHPNEIEEEKHQVEIDSKKDHEAADEPSLEKAKLNFALDIIDLPPLSSPNAPSVSPVTSSSSSSSSSSSFTSESCKLSSRISSRSSSSSRSNSFSSLPPRSPIIPSSAKPSPSSSHKVLRGSSSSLDSTSSRSAASNVPEDPETEQTVDGLVSFVVQSWSEPNTPQPSPVPSSNSASIVADDESQKIVDLDVPCCSTSSTTEPIEVLKEPIIEEQMVMEKLLKKDPVAQLLLKRITLLEKALEQSTTST
jgi:hypothetical protein